MQEIYLIRHGQAGLRDDYDQLSELGAQQATQLADWFRGQSIEFDLVISGALRRQRETAAKLGPAVQIDPHWNEFNLDAVYATVGPQLSAVDEEFRKAHADLNEQSRDPAHPVHREWKACDIKLIEAWIGSRFEATCESWPQFLDRIRMAVRALDQFPKAQRIALVTSATPIGITTASLFGASERKYMELAAALHNTSFTILRRRASGLTLSAFNHTPHLPQEKQRTLR